MSCEKQKLTKHSKIWCCTEKLRYFETSENNVYFKVRRWQLNSTARTHLEIPQHLLDDEVGVPLNG